MVVSMSSAMSSSRMVHTLLPLAVLVTLVTLASAGDNKEGNNKEKLAYAKGSVCQYCEYCQFCVLCEEQCPCETSPRQPACHMCKYCTYCKFCKICDTVCQAGGFLDTLTGSLVSMLPSFDKADVDSDIAGVRTHINKKKDEL